MSKNLTKDLEDLELQISASDDASRALLLAKLEKTVRRLEEKGGVVPDQARAWLRGRNEDAVEEMFDNLPV